MPVIFSPAIIEGKVYRGKKRSDDDEEKRALAELQTILNAKNRRPCDCEAQIHDLVENCLNCGRLTCESEGPGKCFSCGSLVLQEDQKRRFAKFIDLSYSYPQMTGRGCQNRSSQIRIIDNQFDQSSIENQHHLGEKDKSKMKDTMRDLQSKKYQRKLILEVDIDKMEAGCSSEPLIENFSAEVQRLQLNHHDTTKHPTLMEVMDRKEEKVRMLDSKKKDIVKDKNGKRL